MMQQPTEPGRSGRKGQQPVGIGGGAWAQKLGLRQKVRQVRHIAGREGQGRFLRDGRRHGIR